MSKTRKHKSGRKMKTAGSGARLAAARRAGLSAADARLWSQITSNTAKLSVRAGHRVSQLASDARLHRALFEEMISVPARQLGGDRDGRLRAPGGGPIPAPGSAARHKPAAADFDRRKARKVAKGRIEIDARIDLHGMRQREAHSALRSFLMDAHAKGHRLVLVITGKGTRQGRWDDHDCENPHREWGDSFEQPGILKRNVPGWMSETDLAAVVVSYTGAHQRHGGDGALYVQLKKRMSHKPEV